MESPVPALLGTNQVPSASETAQIHDYLAAAAPEAARLEQEVLQLEKRLSLVVAARNSQRELLQEHLALLSPMRRVPEDVLRLIFIETLPQTRDVMLTSDEGPLLLAQICSEWRGIALDMPILWSSMNLSIPRRKTPASSRPSFNRIVATYLERSRTAPLSVTISAAPESGDIIEVPGALQNLLVDSSARLQSLCLPSERNAASIRFLFELSPAQLPMLEHLSFSHLGHGFPTVASAPNLRSLTVHGDMHSLSVVSAFSNLRKLDLWEFKYGMFDRIVVPLDLFQRCALLEELFYGFRLAYAYQVDFPEQPATVNLERLTKLSVSGLETRELAAFCDRITFPNLSALALVSPRKRPMSRWEYTTQSPLDCTWLVASRPRLTSLHLTDPFLPADTLIAVLSAVPELHELSLQHEPQRHHINIRRFIPGPGTDEGYELLCPLLRRIRITNIECLSDSDIVAFLLSRSHPGPGVAALRRAQFCMIRVQQLDISGQLQSQLAAGTQPGGGGPFAVVPELFIRYRPPPAAPSDPPYSAKDGVRVRDPFEEAFCFPDQEYEKWRE